MVRLVFRPYTHVRRTICTSVSLRASIKVSLDFALHKHSSPSFGSQHTCSCQGKTHYPRGDRKRSNAIWVTCALGFDTRILAHILDSLVRVSRRVGSEGWPKPGTKTSSHDRVLAERTVKSEDSSRSPEYSKRRTVPKPTDSLASNDFAYCLTLSPKCFSSFPHGTCSLSVSRQYLALDGIYHPFWSAFPNKPTLGKRITKPFDRSKTGFSPSMMSCSKELVPTVQQKTFL